MALPSINLDAKEMQKAPSTRAREAAQLPASSAAPTGGTRCSRLSHGDGSDGIVLIHRTADPILPDPPPGKDAARANLLLYGRCRSPKAPPALRHGHPHHETPHIPAPTSRRGRFYPATARHRGAGTPSAPIPHRGHGARPPPGSIRPNGAASPWRRQRRIPQPPAPLPPPRPRPSPAARSPAAPTRDPTPGVPRAEGWEVTAGIGGRLDPRGTDKATPIPRRAARRGSLTERTRTRYLPALRGAEPARPLPTMGRGRPAPPRSAAPPRPAR